MRNFKQKRFNLTDKEIKRNQFEMFIGALVMALMLLATIYFSF